jgi:hypothetical protein
MFFGHRAIPALGVPLAASRSIRHMEMETDPAPFSGGPRPQGETMLFSGRSIWTMIHGIALGGAGLLALSAVIFALYLIHGRAAATSADVHASRPIAMLSAFGAAILWLATLAGTYVIFPPYRATPPEGTTNLSAYPRALVLSDSSTRWLHSFAMETKEHLPYIASMLVTSVAFVAWRYRGRLLADDWLRRTSATVLVICFVLVAYIALLGVFVNKVAPLD